LKNKNDTLNDTLNVTLKLKKMIDNWFKNDIEKILKTNKIAVLIDESKQAEFLLDTIKNQYKIYRSSNDLEELHVKYQIEKNDTAEKCIIYTQLPKDKLTFVREYCETNGNIEIKFLHNYIKEKIFGNLKINLNLDTDELISAAKISIGKTDEYWQDISNKGTDKIFDMEKELIPFLDNPVEYCKSLDLKVKEIFFHKICILINSDYIEKPVETFADEIVEYIFNSILINKLEKPFKEIYFNWIDSNTYKPSFEKYLKKFKLPRKINFEKVHSSHPFLEIDKIIFSEIGKNLQHKPKIKDYLPLINSRANDKIANLLNITFWKDVKILLSFDEKSINKITDFESAIEFYKTEFYKVDTSIRNIYTCFLNEPDILKSYQEYYNNLEIVFLDKWFKYFAQYKENQTGTLAKLIEENNCKTAVIVGDGVSFEISQSIAHKLNKHCKITNQTILCGLPSETEHNMSLIYSSETEIIKIHSQRNQKLISEFSDKNIGFIQLDDISETSDNFEYLICTYKDIDSIGEKLQQKALKFFTEIEDVFVKKIEQLLKNGYKKVYLISDHGFVLTGLISEANKIEINFKGKVHKTERYIRTVEKQNIDTTDFIEIEQKYEEYNYLYFSKTINPFKTTGAYGYCHGGLSPQELITPFICFENRKNDTPKLNVVFSNKSDLNNVAGDLYILKIQSEILNSIDLFKSERKVFLMFFVYSKEINKSDIFTMSPNSSIEREYSFEGYKKIDIKLLDAETKEQIDNVTVTKDNSRDLGGLL